MNQRLATPEETAQIDALLSEMEKGERLAEDVVNALKAYQDAKARLVQHLTQTKTAMQVMTECYDSLDKTESNPRN